MCGPVWSSLAGGRVTRRVATGAGPSGPAALISLPARALSPAPHQAPPPTPEPVEGTLISRDELRREGGLLASPFQEDDLLDPERVTGLQLPLFRVLECFPRISFILRMPREVSLFEISTQL